MATTVGSLLIKIGADTAMIKRDMEVIGNVFNKFEKNTKGALVNVRNAMMGLVSIVAVKKLASEIKSVIDTVDKMRDSARILGVTTESLSKLQYAASLSGVSIDDLQSGLQKMTKSIGQAAHGTGKAGDALQQLHLKAKDLINLSPDEQFLRIADALSKVKNSSEQGRLSVEIFSKAGQGLLSLIQEGRGTIEGFGEELQRIGGVVGTDFANSCDAANDAIERFDKSVFGLKMTLIRDLVPAISDAAQWMTELINQSGLVAYNKDLKEYQELTYQMERLIKKRKSLENQSSAALLGASEKHPYRIWAKEELEKTKADIEFTDLQIRLAQRRMSEQEKIVFAPPPETAKPKMVEGILDDIKKEKKAKLDQPDNYIEALKPVKKLYIRSAQEELDKLAKIEEDKWKAIIGTNAKMSDEMIESYLSHLRKMGSTEEEIIQARFDVWKRHTDDWKKGLEVGLKEFQDSLGTETEQWADITDNAFQSMRNTAGDFASALMWDFDNIGESFRNMLKQMAMDITRTLVQRSVIDPLVGMLSGAVGGLLGGSSGVGSDIFGGMFDSAFGGAAPWHSGGVVPKYHSGGRVPGSGPSLGILQGGEYVIPKLHYGANDTALQSLINKNQVPDYSGVSIPSGTLSKWDIPQFGFYGSELMKQYGIGAKPGASVGMPGSYYTKYGAGAEPRFLSEMLLGQYGPGTAGSLQSAFSGGLPAVLKNISGMALPLGAGEYYREGIAQHAGIKGVSDYIYLMSALAGVGAGKSPWLSMLPGVPAIPYPTDAQAVQDILNLGPKKFGMVKKHSGGLMADEQMAILQAGEAVIPKRSVSMNRELIDSLISGGGKRFHEGGMVGQGSSSPSITINVENRGSNPVNVTQGPTVVSQGRILATMVIDEIRRNPNMRNALR